MHDQKVMLLFWVLAAVIMWEGHNPPGSFSSDLDQNRAVLWSKSEIKHQKHPKHLMWMLGLLFCKHFKELGGKIKDGVHKRQDQKGMLLFPGWIDAIDTID